MSEYRKSREELLDELVGIITAGLALRSDDELETLTDLLEGGQLSGLETLPSPHGSVLVQVDPAATRATIAEALQQLSSWVEENWEAERVRLQGIPIPSFPEEPDLLN